MQKDGVLSRQWLQNAVRNMGTESTRVPLINVHKQGTECISFSSLSLPFLIPVSVENFCRVHIQVLPGWMQSYGMNQEEHCSFSFFKNCRWVCEGSRLRVMQTSMADSNKLSAVSDLNNRVFHLHWHSEAVRARTNRLRVCHVLWQQFEVLLLELWE
jgi:hypothetical protein